MHEFVQMPVGWSAAYVADWVVFAMYAAYVLSASVLSAAYRARVHRGTWLHVAEGWAIVAVVWGACGWAKYVLASGDRDWSGAGPVPHTMRVAAIILFALQPAIYLLPVIMVITTAVRAWRFTPARPAEVAGSR